MKFSTYFSLALLTILVSGGCKKDAEKEAREPTAKPSATATLPEGLFLDEEPDGARGVGEVKADEDATGEVVVFGRVGGRKDPFVDGSAMFLLADAEMKSCDELHGDACKTPWDYCCEPRDSLLAKTATVQVVGEDGKPLRVNLSGHHGLEPLKHVVIAGKVSQRGEGGSLVINAAGIYVKPVGG